MNHFPFIICSSAQPIKNKWFLESFQLEMMFGELWTFNGYLWHCNDDVLNLFMVEPFHVKKDQNRDFHFEKFSGCYWYTNNFVQIIKMLINIERNPSKGEKNIFFIVRLSSKYLRVTHLNTLLELLEFHLNDNFSIYYREFNLIWINSLKLINLITFSWVLLWLVSGKIRK
jgi:hypothetical protein